MTTPAADAAFTARLEPELRFAAAAGAAGFLAWLTAPALGGPAPLSLEHGFATLPLVTAPFALQLLGRLSGGRSRWLEAAIRLQPLAGAGVLASFFVASGPLAGALVVPWLMMALVVGLGGLRRAAGLSLKAAHVFLPIGAVWLLLARLGTGPRQLSATTVMLAALHFHFSGVVLQLMIAAAGRALTCPRLGRLCRAASLVTVIALPAIAAGNLLGSRGLKAGGVAAMVLGALLAGALTLAVARRTAAPAARALLGLAAASHFVAMVLAGIYGAGELRGSAWLGVDLMTSLHGALNALGFAGGGLAGHLLRR